MALSSIFGFAAVQQFVQHTISCSTKVDLRYVVCDGWNLLYLWVLWMVLGSQNQLDKRGPIS